MHSIAFWQDQARVLKEQLQAMAPGLRLFLGALLATHTLAAPYLSSFDLCGRFRC